MKKDIPHPSRETRERFPTDEKLRAWGFRLKARPDKGEPIWELDGMKFTQTEALILVEETGE